MYRPPTTRLAAVLTALWLTGSSAHGEKSKEQVCAQVANKAERTLWDSVRKSADEQFCRKPWVARTPGEFMACASSNKIIRFSNNLKNQWNKFFAAADAEWATWGPRSIGPECETGTIQGGFKRTFFGAGLAYTRSIVKVAKTGGTAEAFVTVCELDYDGKVVSSHRRSFPNGQGNFGLTRTVEIEHDDTRVVGVVVDTPVTTNAFSYQTSLETDPIKNDIGPLDGIADLHVHQTADLAFAGRFYWGSHTGDKATALRPEELTGRIDPTAENLEEVLLQLTEPGVDANIFLAGFGGKESDEGFWQLGGAGHPGYEDWPHHADRSHQQAHISWVEEAHKRGLNLMVASMVHNDVFCGILKFLDPYGNVAAADGSWESQNWQCTDHENVLRQLEAVHALENRYPWYRVAMTPWHARQIIDDGDLAVVVSLETDRLLSSEGGNYGNYRHQLDEYRIMGVSTMPLVHESNSKFCGAAPHRKTMDKLQLVHHPWKSLGNMIRTAGSPFNVDRSSGRDRNRLGLTTEGKDLVDALVAREMPIDLAHGSERCRLDIMSHTPAGYGLYDSHTKFERLLGEELLEREREFLITEALEDDYVEHQVLVGLRTSSVDSRSIQRIGGVAVPEEDKVANTCPGSTRSFAQHLHLAHGLGLDVAFGTDFNTGVSQLGPRFGPGRCYAAIVEGDEPGPASRKVRDEGSLPPRARQAVEIDGTNYWQDGLANIGWLPEVAADLRILRTPGASQLAQRSAENYLQMWERSYSSTPDAPFCAPPQPKDLGQVCYGDLECASSRCSGVGGLRGECVCNDDPDCGDDRWCDDGLDLTKNTCQAKKNDNEVCALVGGGHQCKGGHCAWSRCYTPGSVAAGGTCYVDDACTKGKCSSIDGTKGTCVCDGDGDCDSGYWCDKGLDLKKNSCKKKLNLGEVCGTAGELGVGHRCKSGKCKVTGFSTKLKCVD